nr:B3 domain-containing transcription factor VRN1-like [Ipomoea batatas]
MATKPFRRNGGGGSSRPSSSENGPQFFKFIIFSHELTRLRFPLEFVRRHGRNLPKVACLEVPTGEVSKIHVIHDSQGHIWLAKGWEEFTKNYSIREGHFLVFRYDGESHFHVLIFDKTASEIEYPQIIVSHGGVESLEDLSQKCGPNKRKRQEDQTESFCNRFNHVRVKVENSPDDEDEGSPPLMSPKISTGQKQSLVKTAEMDYSAYQRAKAFKFKNPFHISVMSPSYISSKNGRLYIPSPFAKKHFLGQSSNDFVLVSGGRSWPAKCGLSRNCARISGWKAFAVDNKLKVGDVCILEIMKSKKLTVNIIVFPAEEIDD